MKKVILAGYIDNYDYVHDITDRDAEHAVHTIVAKLTDKLSSKYKNVSIDADDVRWSSSRLCADFYIYNKNKQVDSGTFEFTRYSDYEDEDEFQQHLNECIDKFVAYF